MDYGRYRTEFFASRAATVFPADCTNQEPIFVFATRFSWTLTWILTFTDDHYIRIWEHFGKIGGVNSSTRRALSYHYGPMDTPKNAAGHYRVGAPVVMRIDVPTNAPPHLHYLGPDPHYQQSAIAGINLNGVEMFSWLRAVFLHRENGKPLHEILGFTV